MRGLHSVKSYVDDAIQTVSGTMDIYPDKSINTDKKHINAYAQCRYRRRITRKAVAFSEIELILQDSLTLKNELLLPDTMGAPEWMNSKIRSIC